MNNILLYIIQITLIFSILYILYILILSKLTFHNFNRFVLMLLLPVSIIIPFLSSLFPAISNSIIEIPLLEHITFDNVNNKSQTIESSITNISFNYFTALITTYWLVCSIYLLRVLFIIRRLFVLKNNSIIQQKNGYQLIITNVSEIFSYFNWIFIPKNNIQQNNSPILEHEKAHIQLKHSWDVILTEVYIAFFWFNPLCRFYRKSLKSVHEFQADKNVLEKGIKTSQYMELLMQSIEVQKPNNLYNYFNQPILKKRITMMTKPKSNRLSKLKYILFLPICVFLIFAFTSPITKDNKYLNILEVSEFIKAAPSLFPVQGATKNDISAFFGEKRKHPKVNKGAIHHGIDIKATQGAPVIATAHGIVAKAAMEGDWGNLIVITHSDGYETWYAHLKSFNSSKNQEVKKGTIIGYVGNTGRSSGPHLHYEVKHNGKRVNPLNYME